MLNKLKTELSNHPASLPPLFFTEMWERFSYYGMRSILLLYIYFSIIQGGLGLPQVTAASIVSIYGSLIFISSLLGGYLSDRVLNPYKTVLFGGLMIMAGHIVLAIPGGLESLFLSLFLIILGTGLLKPNIATMIGLSYKNNEKKKDIGYTLFILAINIGAFIAPIIVGYVGQTYSFHLGFSFAAIGMFFGLLIYYVSKHKMPTESFKTNNPLKDYEKKKLLKNTTIALIITAIAIVLLDFCKLLTIENIILLIAIIIILIPIYFFRKTLKSKELNLEEKSKVKSLIPLFLSYVLMIVVYGQIPTTLTIFATEHINLAWIPVSWIQALDPMFALFVLPFLALLWKKLENNPPSTPLKFSIGLFFSGASFLILIIPISINGLNTLLSPFWLIASLFILVIGYALIYPIGVSVTSKLAPNKIRAQMMGIWLIGDSVGEAIVSQTVKVYPNNELLYFGIWGIIIVIGGIILFLMRHKVSKLMSGVI
ncbi:MAG: oligopeptide:H+ symporter [Methanobrevibacter sp.]|jgi:POT family proton-dependent oligopeptide transporter|nr:oligopeptide:H+ symporter [Candidatus Methanoflexus mossambicus]